MAALNPPFTLLQAIVRCGLTQSDAEVFATEVYIWTISKHAEISLMMIYMMLLKDTSKQGFKKNHVPILTNKLYKPSKPKWTTSLLQVPLLPTFAESLKLQVAKEVEDMEIEEEEVEEEDTVAVAMEAADPEEEVDKTIRILTAILGLSPWKMDKRRNIIHLLSSLPIIWSVH